MTWVLREWKTDGGRENPTPPLGPTDRQTDTGYVYRVIHPDKGVQSHKYTSRRDQLDTDSHPVNTPRSTTQTGPANTQQPHSHTNTRSDTQTTRPQTRIYTQRTRHRSDG